MKMVNIKIEDREKIKNGQGLVQQEKVLNTTLRFLDRLGRSFTEIGTIDTKGICDLSQKRTQKTEEKLKRVRQV